METNLNVLEKPSNVKLLKKNVKSNVKKQQ